MVTKLLYGLHSSSLLPNHEKVMTTNLNILKFHLNLLTQPMVTRKRKHRRSKKSSASDNVCQYQCTHCAHTTPNWSNFEDHNKIFHRVHVMLKCAVPKCFKFYISKNGLKGLCIHENKDVLSCNLCDYIATGPDFLIDHKKSHDLKKFKCPFCTKGFGSAYDQNHHQA